MGRRNLMWGATVLALSACSTTPEHLDPCAEARIMVGACGVSIPSLDRHDCEGPASLLAGCILEHASTCDELALLRIDDCASDLDFNIDGDGE